MKILHFVQPGKKCGGVERNLLALALTPCPSPILPPTKLRSVPAGGRGGPSQRGCHDKVLPLCPGIQAAGESGRNNQPRPIGVDQRMRGIDGARAAWSRLDQHDLAIAVPSLPYDETVAAGHTDLAQRIDEATGLNR